MSEILRLQKQPDEVLTRDIDCSGRLSGSVTVSSATATVIDILTNEVVTSTILSSATATVSSPNLTYTFQNGIDGRKYLVKILATLSNSDITEIDLILTVREL